MKNKIIAVFISVVLITTAFTLTSCENHLSGTYSNNIAGTETSYYFHGDNVTVTVTTTLLGNTVSKAYEGEYEITTMESGARFIEFDFDTDRATLYEGTKTLAVNEEDGIVTIGGIEYKKRE